MAHEAVVLWERKDFNSLGCTLAQVLLVSDFGPKTALKIVDTIRKDILAGRLKSGPQIKVDVSSPLPS